MNYRPPVYDIFCPYPNANPVSCTLQEYAANIHSIWEINERQVISRKPTTGQPSIISMSHNNHLAMYCDIPNAADTYSKARPVAKTAAQSIIKDESAEIQRDNDPDSQAASAESRPPMLPLSTYSSWDHQGMHVAFLRSVGADIPHFSSVGTPSFQTAALNNAAL